ncbi:tyrosine-type recombinase/integrase [Companilactobacillus futsaii]|uniref:tyrosine-type recombinase/integrase n=1 Tax=Companilactobacillus futsaii TaxID=938155 RepID=UPI00189CB7F3|nr:site-specific integrase [Companilactobacillus futsaii]
MKQTRYVNVYKDKDGKFFYQVFVGRDEKGKSHFKKGRKDSNGKPFTSARMAHNEAIKVKNDALESSGRVLYRMTYKTFMNRKFIPKYKGDVEESTFNSHERIWNILIKQFGDKVLNKIDIMDCESFRTWLLTDSGYTNGYSSMIYIAFRQSLDYAVLLGILDSNVSKRTKAIPKGKAIVKYWTKSDFEKAISQICMDSYYERFSFMMIWLYFMTGVRVSEGLALTWDDVDLRNNKLNVYHNLFMKNKKDYEIHSYTKTSSGKRKLSLDDDTVEFLKKWKKDQAKHGVKKFVISYDDTPMVRSTVNRIVKRYAELANVPEIDVKGLRHSHVSYLINEFNADVLTVSRRLGHSSPDITLKYYSHLWNRNDDGLAKMMTGNIKFDFSDTTKISFNGNQAVSSKSAQ